MDWSNVFLYGLIYSFSGWAVETIYCSVSQGAFVERGFLNGPICPIYGVGAVYVIYFVSPFVQSLVGLFLLSMVATTLIEYVTSYLMEKIFAMRWWDYTEKKFNIRGRVCLENSIYFGILSVVLIRWIHPNVEYFVYGIPIGIKNSVSLVLAVVVALDITVSAKAAFKLNFRFEQISELREDIQNIIGRENLDEKIEVLKSYGQYFIDEKYEDWREFKENINGLSHRIEVDFSALPLYKRLKEIQMGSKLPERRILRAFPKLRSIKYNDILQELKKTMNDYKKKG